MKMSTSKDALAKLLAEHEAAAGLDGANRFYSASDRTKRAREAVVKAFSEQWDLIGNLVAAAREDRSHDALRKALRAELSEEYWCAGWLHDVEVLLCGGWHTYEEFVPLDEWERRFAQRTPRPTA